MVPIYHQSYCPLQSYTVVISQTSLRHKCHEEMPAWPYEAHWERAEEGRGRETGGDLKLETGS